MNFGQFFQDGTGAYSATRLAFLLWAIGVLVIWIYESIVAGKLVTIDSTVVTVLGALMAGKVVQAFSPSDAGPAANQAPSKPPTP